MATERQKLVTKLDKVFSKFIRARDSRDGYFACISCGRFKAYSEGDCGHYVNRKFMSLRFDEKNCNMQCQKCNRFDEGNALGYTQGIIKKYGQGVIQYLEIRKQNIAKYDVFELKCLIKEYQNKLK